MAVNMKDLEPEFSPLPGSQNTVHKVKSLESIAATHQFYHLKRIDPGSKRYLISQCNQGKNRRLEYHPLNTGKNPAAYRNLQQILRLFKADNHFAFENQQGSHEHWTKIEKGRNYKVTVDCPKSPFSQTLIKSMAK